MDNLQDNIRTALDSLELSLDPTIWRTKLRIQEVMITNNPTLKDNPFATHLNHLFMLLIAWVSTWAMVLSTYRDVQHERYEEGEAEPILTIDIPQIKTYGTAVEFCERFYAIGLMQWKDYHQVRDELKSVWMAAQVDIISKANEVWLVADRVFYRRVDTPKSKTKRELPSLVIA